ncbi:hypothetical protein V6N13_054741 [Hibiscus sabdariffa]
MMVMESKWLWFLRIAVLSVLLVLEGAPTDACLQHERIALLQLKPFFNHYNELADWDEVTGSDCCQWKGIECNTTSSRLIGLSLNSTRNQIKNIPSFKDDATERQQMIHLEELNLEGNLLNNTVFASLKVFSNLKYLDISFNRMKGSLDIKDLDAFSSLRELYMSNNQLKDFVIHKGCCDLKKLEVLDLSWNVLSHYLQLLI